MRTTLPPALALLSACGLPAAAMPHAASVASSAESALSGDQADSSCQVVLRYTAVNFQSGLGPQTHCSSGTCWVVIPIVFDVAMSEDQASATAYVLYSGADGLWHQSPAAAIWGAQLGYRRYQAVLDSETFTSGASADTVQFIPFIQTVAGPRLFDHNRLADPLANYQLTASNNWTLDDDHATCQGAAPHGIETLVFAQPWQDSGYGSLVESGKLDLNYDVYRIPQGLGCTTDGVGAFAVTAFVQFQPGGNTLSERIDGPLDFGTGRYTSVPLEFDVPANASSASLWFLDSSECTGDHWDSDYGQNYVYPVYAEQQPG